MGYECYRFFHINGLRIRKITKGTFIGAKIINQKISAPKADIKTSAPKADIKTSAPKADIQNRTTTREPPKQTYKIAQQQGNPQTSKKEWIIYKMTQ